MKKSGETGLPLFAELPDIELINWDDRSVSLSEYRTRESAIFFVSVTCMNCIDLLPYLSEIETKFGYSIVVLSAGARDDHEAMIDYFGWSFPLVGMSMDEMKKWFQIEYLPFVILTSSDGKVSNKGVVYHADDFGFLVKHCK